jgi:amino acid adenylation domain-containing protein
MSVDRDSFLRFRSLADAFRAIASKQPDATLLSYEGSEWSHQEIDAWSNGIARRIIERFGRRKQVIGVLSSELPLVLASYLGVLKAGSAYAGLDPALPNERLAALKDVAGISSCITDQEGLPQATLLMQSADSILVVDLKDSSNYVSDLDVTIQRTDICHILFTSGSTGQPKAVPRSHEDQLHNVERHGCLNLNSSDRVMLISRRGFFDTVSNPFAPMLFGATTCAIRLLNGGDDLARWLAQERVTVYYSFPTIFRQLLATSATADALACLRLVYLGGEGVHLHDLVRCRELLRPEARVAVGLGSTETGVTAIKLHTMRDGVPDVVTVGKPLSGVRIEIWDDDKVPLGSMGVGTIVFRSRFMFHGYLGDDDRNGRSIYPDPEESGSYIFESGDRGYFDAAGELVVAGRRDDVVKLRGFRIELGEIEATLRRHPAVREAVALLASTTGSPQDDELIAFVAAPAEAVNEEVLRPLVKEKLPGHMVPARVFVVESLPRTANGKADRRGLVARYISLREKELAERSRQEPQGRLETKVAALWSELLKVPGIGRQDRFFSLGGNSLKALIFMSQLNEELAGEIPLMFLFEDDQLFSFCDRCSTYLASA